MKYKNKKGVALIPIILIFSLLGVGLVLSGDVSADNQDYETIVTMERLDLMLQSYFSNLNTTEIYNTYNDYITNRYYNITNITNMYSEYYYYNQTFLNQTFNDFITNEYYEDNYYNTYNTYNQTFLNQTFIDNDYYTTNYNYNESAFESMLSSINDIWDYINNQENEKIKLSNLTNPIIDLSGSNCNQIEFMFKDSNILSIYDVLGLGISTQLAQVNNINIEHSIFVDNNDDVIENNVYDTYYDDISSSNTAIRSDNNDDFEINFNSSLIDNELLFNWASERWNENSRTNIFNIYENNVKRLEVYARNGRIYLKNSVTGDTEYHTKISSKSNYQFTMYKLDIHNTYVDLYDENEVLLVTMDIDFSSNENSVITLEGENTDNRDIYIRSIYLNNGILEIINDKFVIDSEEFEFDNHNWNKAEIYITSNSLLYNINNHIITQDYNLALNQTKDNYHLVINTDETSLFNLYCRN